MLSKRCETCSLSRCGPPVEGEGEGRKLLIVGEAPGREERTQKRPFIGDSGQVLRGLLRQLDVSPQDVRITNVVKCRPPDNRTPRKAEIQQCLPHLLEGELKPGATLLLLGNTAIQALTSERKGSLSVRGEWRKAGDNWAMLSIHPAYIIRTQHNGDRWLWRFQSDVLRALRGYVAPEEPECSILGSLDDVRAYFDMAEASSDGQQVIIAWDLETTGYRFYEHDILAMSLSHEKGTGWVIPEEVINDPTVKSYLVTKFNDPRIRWIGHGARFDQVYTLRHMGAYPVSYADTMLMHVAVDEMSSHDMKLLARDYCDASDWESELWKYLPNREASYALAPRGVLYKYAAFDAHYTLRLQQLLHEELVEDDVVWVNDNILTPAAETMMLAEFAGVQLDLEMINEWQVKLEAEMERLAAELTEFVQSTTREKINEKLGPKLSPIFWKWTPPKSLRIHWDKSVNMYKLKDPEMVNGLQLSLPSVQFADLERYVCWRVKLVEKPFSANSWMQVGTVCYEVVGLKYLKGKDARAKGKSYSTTDASLTPYASEHEVVRQVLGYRTTRKAKSTYIDGLFPDEYGRVHPKWRVHGSVTGRLSCSDPNMMNQPHESGVRDFFVASPDHILLSADYSQAELRIMGAYAIKDLPREEAEKSFFVRVYRDGRDLHDEATAILFGENWREHDAYAKRMLAKAFNFGLIYGRSVKSIAAAFGMTIRDAQALVDRFFSGMPEVLDFISRTEKAIHDPGELTNVFGRKRRFPYVDGRNESELRRQARNFMAQSTASDLTMLCTIEVSKWFRENGWGNVLVFLHDSMLVEVPECAWKLTAQKIHQVMTTLPIPWLGDLIPFKTDVSVGYSWGSLYDVNTNDWTVPGYGKEN